MTWRWVSLEIALAVHDRQIAEHGGRDGLRDRGALESALARPLHRATYQGTCDIADLAACYAWGIMRNHPFVDGNKRTGWVVARIFLADNGARLRFGHGDAIATVEAIAAGVLPEAALARWLRERATHPRPR